MPRHIRPRCADTSQWCRSAELSELPPGVEGPALAAREVRMSPCLLARESHKPHSATRHPREPDGNVPLSRSDCVQAFPRAIRRAFPRGAAGAGQIRFIPRYESIHRRSS